MISSKWPPFIVSLFIVILIHTGTIVSFLAPEEEPITIYSHGSLCNKWTPLIFQRTTERSNMFCSNAFILGPMKTFNYQDCIFPFLSCMGQDDDIQRLHEACKDHKKVILIGSSRGAAAIINYLGTYKPTNIIGAVIESTFDVYEHVFDKMLSAVWITNKETQKKLLPYIYKNYKPDGIQPIQMVDKIPHSIPLLFICSKEDGLVPDWTTINVFNGICQAGHKKAYLLHCDKGSHGRIIWGPEGETFRDVVHAFYKRFNLPYCCEEWAQKGWERFNACLSSVNNDQYDLATA